MVLQAQPTDAVIWGFLGDNKNPVNVDAQCILKGKEINLSQTYFPTEDDDKFQVIVPATEGTVCDFTISQDGSEVSELKDVVYGDVWVCSGQSNMQFTMGGIFNATTEIAAMSEYPGIRLYRVVHMTSDEPQDDLMNEDAITWVKSNNAARVGQFSAVCLLTAKYMADVLGKE